jgi:polyhydroxyalkanoate synthase
MYLTYLRRCYLDNALAQSQMAVAGTPLTMAAIDQDLYVLSAVEDHIAPWKSSYKTTQLVSGNTRFVLSSSGHIAGIINPPSPRTRHWTNDDLDPDPDVWRANAVEHQASWWEDWAQWISTRAGDHVPARAIGSAEFPPIMDAPGSYVFG